MPSFENTLGLARWIARQYGEGAPQFIVGHLGIMFLVDDEAGLLEWKQVAAAYVLLQSAAGGSGDRRGDDEDEAGPSLSEMRRREVALRMVR